MRVSNRLVVRLYIGRRRKMNSHLSLVHAETYVCLYLPPSPVTLVWRALRIMSFFESLLDDWYIYICFACPSLVNCSCY